MVAGNDGNHVLGAQREQDIQKEESYCLCLYVQNLRKDTYEVVQCLVVQCLEGMFNLLNSICLNNFPLPLITDGWCKKP